MWELPSLSPLQTRRRTNTAWHKPTRSCRCCSGRPPVARPSQVPVRLVRQRTHQRMVGVSICGRTLCVVDGGSHDGGKLRCVSTVAHSSCVAEGYNPADVRAGHGGAAHARIPVEASTIHGVCAGDLIACKVGCADAPIDTAAQQLVASKVGKHFMKASWGESWMQSAWRGRVGGCSLKCAARKPASSAFPVYNC